MDSKFVPMKTRSGRITGYLEVFYSRTGMWMSIPGVSRWKEPDGTIRPPTFMDR